MIRFFYNASPNPLKVALFLEEAGLPYEACPVDTRRGHQHEPGYVAINPNAKVPAIIDGDAVVFDSNAILLYLAEKTGKFLPANKDSMTRGALLSWLMFVASGVGPYSGQAVHFRNVAPGENAYSRKRYDFEARRHWAVVDDRLARGRYMLGDDYTIVDMSVWGWASRIPLMLGGEDAMASYPNIARLMAELDARPAAARAIALKDRYSFKAELDDQAMRFMYPQIFSPDPA
ncbi:glutathione S-transferase family protein [Tabrizicola sp. BL-A-41-H6]|uniref:glutathione S-transferase family protein n=1 Tax=Tabrizicola sp. BL-A-41-H6 TaxID=3421107 RepID=UPI003D663F86